MYEMMYYKQWRPSETEVFLPGRNGQKYMRCDCGCNVFRQIQNKPHNKYKCNSCFAIYTAYNDEKDYLDARGY